MKITNTSPREKRSNINHVINEAKNNVSSGSRHWSWDGQAEANSLKANRHDFRIPRRTEENTKWVFNFTEKQSIPVTEKPVIKFNVTGLNDTEKKGCKFTVKDEEGNERTVFGKIITKVLVIGPFGTGKTVVEFRKSQRGRNVRDMRTNTLRSPEFIKAEIRRLIPAEAEKAIAELLG